MGVVNLPNLQNYWSRDLFLQSNSIWKQVMSRYSFLLHLRFWHFEDKTSPESRLQKISPLIDHLNNTMSKIYCPRRKPLSRCVNGPVERQTDQMTWIQSKVIVGAPPPTPVPLLKHEVGPSKNLVTWGGGGYQKFARKEGITLKRGGWCRNGCCQFFITLQFNCIYCMCVWGEQSFLYYI